MWTRRVLLAMIVAGAALVWLPRQGHAPTAGLVQASFAGGALR